MRCLNCGTLVWREGVTRCAICSTRFNSAKPFALGEAEFQDRQRRFNKGRSAAELLEAYNMARKNGLRIHMEAAEKEKLARILSDIKRNPTETTLRLKEGAYD